MAKKKAATFGPLSREDAAAATNKAFQDEALANAKKLNKEKNDAYRAQRKADQDRRRALQDQDRAMQGQLLKGFALREAVRNTATLLGGPTGQMVGTFIRMTGGAKDLTTQLTGIVDLSIQMVRYAVDLAKQYRSANMGAATMARQMGGTVGHAKELSRTFSVMDKYIGADEGWSQGAMGDFRKLGMNMDQAEGALRKFQRAALPENMGLEDATALKDIFVGVNNQLHHMGTNGRISMKEIIDMTRDNIPLQKEMLASMKEMGVSSLDATHANELFNKILEANSKVKLPDPAQVTPNWMKLGNYLKDEFMGAAMDMEKRFNEVLDPANYDGASFKGFVKYWTGVDTGDGIIMDYNARNKAETEGSANVTHGLETLVPGLIDKAGKLSVASKIQTAENYKQWKELGEKSAEGFVLGLSAMSADVAGVLQGAVKAGNNTLQVRSPSRVFAKMGDYSGQGFNKGLANSLDIAGTLQNQVVGGTTNNSGGNTFHLTSQTTNHIQAGSGAQGSEFGESYGGAAANALFQQLQRALGTFGG